MSDNLTQRELAAIYRQLRPGTIYYGEQPHQWTIFMLIRQIKIALAEDGHVTAAACDTITKAAQ